MTKRKSTAAKKPPLSGAGLSSESKYVWVFQCSSKLALHAATLDPRARNLPKTVCQGAEWTRNGLLVMGPHNAPMAGIDVIALIVGIEKDGYYIWNADMEPPLDTTRLMR
jgi:hypothetical protein